MVETFKGKEGIGITRKRTPAVLVLLVMVFCLSWAGGQPEILFECPNLEKAIRDAEGFTGSFSGPIYANDVLGVTQITAAQSEIISLEGIEHLVNLQGLELNWNQIKDITPLQNLVALQRLYFGGNQVSDLTPLKNLSNLRELWFGSNQVSDLSPLQNLTNLKWLWFQSNQVTDIAPIVANEGLGDGDFIEMRYNSLDLSPGSLNMDDIQTLIGRGAIVEYHPQK
jgi:hypothetical protein